MKKCFHPTSAAYKVGDGKTKSFIIYLENEMYKKAPFKKSTNFFDNEAKS